VLSPGFRHRGGLLWSLELIVFGGVLQRIDWRLRRLLQHLEQTLGAADLGLGKIIDQTVKAVSQGHRHLLHAILARAGPRCRAGFPLQLDVRITEEGHALRQEAYQREREALKDLAEERERRHKAELLALEAQMQAKLEALTRANNFLAEDLQRANALLSCKEKKGI
jgi:hypothetical protein